MTPRRCRHAAGAAGGGVQRSAASRPSGLHLAWMRLLTFSNEATTPTKFNFFSFFNIFLVNFLHNFNVVTLSLAHVGVTGLSLCKPDDGDADEGRSAAAGR